MVNPSPIDNYSVKTKGKISNKYQSKELVEQYEKVRFRHPVWKMAHLKEVAIVNRLIKKVHPAKLLEIAPGTARISRNLSKNSFGRGYAIDSSPAMLKITKALLNSNQWEVKQGDAFDLNFPPDYFDLVMTFRFIRHFALADRQRIYAQIRKVLKPKGYLVFEIFNQNLDKIAYQWIGLGGKKGIYDELWTKTEIEQELGAAGFRIITLKRYQNHIPLYHFLDHFRLFWEKVIRKLRLPKGLIMVGLCCWIYRLIDLIPSSHNVYFEVLCQKK